ncbi:hypothetical protein SB761_28520 [Pseudomonas sp. SIMBA_064]
MGTVELERKIKPDSAVFSNTITNVAPRRYQYMDIIAPEYDP